MKDEIYTQPIDESDGSESRFNRIQKPKPPAEPRRISAFESWYEPQPAAPTAVPTEPTPIQPSPEVIQPENLPGPMPKTKNKARLFLLLIPLVLLLLPLFFTPFRITTLILGIDSRPKEGWAGRSDTMILTSLPPFLPQVSMLSIPRDLWVNITPDYQNRINTAHYFAELEESGAGMPAAKQVVESNLGIHVDYVVRLKFTGFVEVVDAMGGVTVNLPTDMSGLTAGKHHLNGTEALKFVRDRQGSDDFFRQQRGQLFISALFKQLLNPITWPRFPVVLVAAAQSVQTDLPVWLWPRIAYGFIFSAVSGFESYTFDRSTITPWVTDEGAQVLLPNWDLMRPVMEQFLK